MYVAQPQPFSSDVLVSAMDANHLEMVMSSILFLTDCQFGTSAGARPPAGPGAQCEQTVQEPAPMFEGIATPPSGLPTATPGIGTTPPAPSWTNSTTSGGAPSGDIQRQEGWSCDLEEVSNTLLKILLLRCPEQKKIIRGLKFSNCTITTMLTHHTSSKIP